jgi:hypothetical protein
MKARRKSSRNKKKSESPRFRRLTYFCFACIGALLDLLPRRSVFLLLVICDIIKLPMRRRLEVAYLPYASSFLLTRPSWRFSGRASRSFPMSTARVLFGIGAYRETSDWIRARGLAVLSTEMSWIVARALFELGEFEKARDSLTARTSTVELEVGSADLVFLKSMLEVVGGDEVAAREYVTTACRKLPRFMRPHQNIAARPGRLYVPNGLDVLCGPSGRLFDLCNFTGQRVTHVGHGDIGVRLFERALAAQSELQALPPPLLSPVLERLLEELQTPFDELRIIPEEWATQIGHLGMLDILFRMRELGWWSGRAIMVVRHNLVANLAFFRLFEQFGKVVVVGETISEEVGEELLSLQRWRGLNFNAFRLPDGTVVPWQEAGALAIEQWEREGRGHPLRDEFDRNNGA